MITIKKDKNGYYSAFDRNQKVMIFYTTDDIIKYALDNQKELDYHYSDIEVIELILSVMTFNMQIDDINVHKQQAINKFKMVLNL